MKSIKFRVWNPELEIMYKIKKENYLGSVGIIDNLVGCEESEWMQYTGLKDSNDIEIYEGDIIWDAHAEIHGKVVFDEGAFCVEWDTHIEHLFEVVTDGYAEVVGSIYENPELMERGSDE